MNWRSFEREEKLFNFDEAAGERQEERLILAQEIQTESGENIAAVIADLAVLPNLERMGRDAKNVTHATLALIPTTREGLWSPDPQLNDSEAGIQKGIVGPNERADILPALFRAWQYIDTSSANRTTFGRWDSQMRGATIGIDGRTLGLNTMTISQNAVTIPGLTNVIVPKEGTNPIFIHRAKLWDVAPTQGPSELPLEVPILRSHTKSLVDALSEIDQRAIDRAYGMDKVLRELRRAFARWRVDPSEGIESRSHWLGSRKQELVRR
ncbi:MAG: hypothetical protein ACI9QC_000630 [Oceanicoccus sp.]|jgi:hypothetical protein